MPLKIKEKFQNTAKPVTVAKTKQPQLDNTKKEQDKKGLNETNKLLLTLGCLAVIAGGIYLATRGKGGNPSKVTDGVSTNSKPFNNTNDMQKNADEIINKLPQLSKEEQELTDLLERERSKYAEIIKTMKTPEAIQQLPENKANLNGIFKTTEQDKTIYHLYEQGQFKGTILPETEGFLLKMDDKNSVFIWSDGEITYQITSKEELPPEIKRYFDSQYTEQEIGNIRISKADNRIGISEIHSVDNNSEHHRGIGFSFVRSL